MLKPGHWLDRLRRPKNGIARRCPLWPETVKAVRAAVAERPKPRQPDAANHVFLTIEGRPWLCRGIANPVSVAARELMKTAGIHRAGLGFYTMRHTFRTVADAVRDNTATRMIMGHADGSIDAVYREHIDDSRLQAVTDHVREWLYGGVDKPVDKAPHGTANEKQSAAQPRRRRPPQKRENMISGRQPPVDIEYDSADGRLIKHFETAAAARPFFEKKHKAGANPKVLNGEDKPVLRIVG